MNSELPFRFDDYDREELIRKYLERMAKPRRKKPTEDVKVFDIAITEVLGFIRSVLRTSHPSIPGLYATKVRIKKSAPGALRTRAEVLYTEPRK